MYIYIYIYIYFFFSILVCARALLSSLSLLLARSLSLARALVGSSMTSQESSPDKRRVPCGFSFRILQFPKVLVPSLANLIKGACAHRGCGRA